ncbi:calcium-binding protein [Nocardiopsis sp. MG754419]|uniref:calcium-binding protein n=1 Tax=Nocardiopsis sp. MG754419 TaxID=2259865 RepID=UPI001BA7E406|nr:calcium-binding protein [Nocardiopsis sp. MG754419]MBR8742307.1 calcium-binding protein [Nocardiopsis sp. MG754419]
MANGDEATERDIEEEDDRARGRHRGGSPSAIAAALTRDPQPGPQHWGGPRPRRTQPDTLFPRTFPRFAPGDERGGRPFPT